MIEEYLKNIDKLDKLERIMQFKEILIKWSGIHNLTGNIGLIDENILDSLRPFEFLKPFRKCVDIGSGAGFPGIILALMYEDREFILIEPRVKRVSFLKFLSIQIELKNISIINDFSYNIILDKRVDLITSRAVGSVESILTNSHLIDENGYFLLFKGEDYTKEISKLSLNCLQVINFNKRNYLYFRKGT